MEASDSSQHQLGMQCSCMIRTSPELFEQAAAWLIDRPTSIRKYADDNFFVFPSNDESSLIEVDVSPKTDGQIVFRRLMRAVNEIAEVSLTRENARRLVLLGALIFYPEFDGAELELAWAWEAEQSEEDWSLVDGRGSVQNALGSSPGVIEDFFDQVGRAFEVLDQARVTSHSEDFTSVNWFGHRYLFAKGHQAEIVGLLWREWEKGGHSLSQETLLQAISAAESNTVQKIFRVKKSEGRGYDPHPAWDTMIQQASKGCYRLVPL